jgi:hypothetical protein
MGARNRVGIRLTYRPARQHRLVESNRFLGSLKVQKYCRWIQTTGNQNDYNGTPHRACKQIIARLKYCTVSTVYSPNYKLRIKNNHGEGMKIQ